MRKVWIEAALDGAWSRKFQPGIPDTIEAIVTEGIACARAEPASPAEMRQELAWAELPDDACVAAHDSSESKGISSA